MSWEKEVYLGAWRHSGIGQSIMSWQAHTSACEAAYQWRHGHNRNRQKTQSHSSLPPAKLWCSVATSREHHLHKYQKDGTHNCPTTHPLECWAKAFHTCEHQRLCDAANALSASTLHGPASHASSSLHHQNHYHHLLPRRGHRHLAPPPLLSRHLQTASNAPCLPASKNEHRSRSSLTCAPSLHELFVNGSDEKHSIQPLVGFAHRAQETVQTVLHEKPYAFCTLPHSDPARARRHPLAQASVRRADASQSQGGCRNWSRTTHKPACRLIKESDRRHAGSLHFATVHPECNNLSSAGWTRFAGNVFPNTAVRQNASFGCRVRVSSA